MSNARQLTRDLLLEYDKAIIPPRPRAAGLGIVYPWETMPISIISKQLYALAVSSGFNGTEIDFKNKFGSYLQDKQVIFEDFDKFPQYGSAAKLYFDQVEKILYYWDGEYIPVNAMLIANTIIEGGEA